MPTRALALRGAIAMAYLALVSALTTGRIETCAE
tara:strand:+ start:1032 stop:1133 length:102 start_codon:yes stop_codon:yes gene_type:complete